MKASRVILEQVASPDNLREAFLRAAKGKSAKPDAIAFRASLMESLMQMREEILNGTMQLGRFSSFTIWEPKERRINAPAFPERVLHHALIGVCEADFERWSVFDSYACRKGKGREAAIRRAEYFASRHPFFLKMDVRKYFDSIPHEVLLGKLRKRFRDPALFALWEGIVNSYETTPCRGLPIGALTSQHLANFYLGRIDNMVLSELKLPGYVRYMDDMVAWGTKNELKAARLQIEAVLKNELGLELKGNWHLQPVNRGMALLGYRVFPGGCTLARASRRRFVLKWAGIERGLERGRLTQLQAQRSVLALAAFVRVARRERILDRLFGFRAASIGHEPRQPGRQLEQQGVELPVCEPQQQRPVQPQQQPRFPSLPQLTHAAWMRQAD
jgi:RNA-directed DNA polymerase